MSKLSKNFRQTLLQKINIKSDIHSLFPYANLSKLFTSKTANYVKPNSSLCYNEDSIEETFPILNLPNEVIGCILEFLDVLDIVRCEKSSKQLSGIIIQMNIYKRKLDRECEVKGINNYMKIPLHISKQMSDEEENIYYKKRLYHYKYIKLSHKWPELYQFPDKLKHK